MSRRSAKIASYLGATSGNGAGAPFTFNRTPKAIVWGGLGATSLPVARADSAAPLREFTERAAVVSTDAPLPRDESAAAFVDWLAQAYPGVVETLLESLGVDEVIARDGQLGATEEKTLVTRLMDLAQGVLPAYLQYEQQKDVLAIQLERAKAGLPPLESGQYAPSVQVGLDQETIRRMADEATSRAAAAASSPLPWLLVGGAVLAAITLRKPKRRRRA